jgi:hypothetical protein
MHTSLWESARGIRRASTSSSSTLVAVVVLKPGGVALVRRFWRVSSLFSIIPSNFEVGKTGASARFSLARSADLICVHVYVL